MTMRALRLGVLGGALGSAVGRAHHIASRMDGRFEIVAGCFSRNPASNTATADALGLASERCYDDWTRLLASERGQLDALLLLTPTPLHAGMASAALEAGFPVIAEKALAVSSGEAAAIRQSRDAADGFVAVTFNYSGYPAVRELRQKIADGELGRVLHVVAEMPQEGFMRLVGQDNALPRPQDWRLKDHFIPTVSLDLGVHLHHLIHFLVGETPLRVCATEQSGGHFPGIVDNVHCLADYSGDVAVQLWFGKTSLGYTNGLKIRVFGTLGAAEWYQNDPEHLRLSDNRGQSVIFERSANTASVVNEPRYNRFKAGHPSGFIEAFANYYSDIADWVLSYQAGDRSPHPLVAGVEVAEEGLRLMEAISTSARQRTWVELRAQA